MITTMLCYPATSGSSVADYGTPCRVDMENVGLILLESAYWRESLRGSNRHPDARSRSVRRLRENRRTCVRQHPRASHHPIGWHHSRHRKRRACSQSASAQFHRSQVLRSVWRVFRSVAQARHGYPAGTTSASDTNARLSRLVAADHSQAHEHGWTELLTHIPHINPSGLRNQQHNYLM